MQAVIHAYRGLSGSTVNACEVDDRLLINAANPGYASGWVVQRARRQLFKAQGMFGDIGVIEPIFGDQHVHHAEGKRTVGAGFEGNMLMAFFRRQRAVWVDRDQTRTVAFGLLRAGPKVQIRCDRIRSPDQNELALGEVFRQHAETRTVGVLQTGRAGRRADRTVQLGCAQLVEESLGDAVALDEAHRSGVAIRNDRLGSAARNFR